MRLSKQAKKVQDALDEFGLELNVYELDDTTRTSLDAAKALGCKVGQIAKSLLFTGLQTNNPHLIVASGKNRVDEKQLESIIGEKIELASATAVREKTGFEIGGVPPIGHTEKIPIYIDEDLMTYDRVWAAAGTSHAIFSLTPDELVKITKGEVIKIT